MEQLTSRRIALGLILVLAGALLLFKNLGMLPYYFSDAIFNWPMLVMLIGVLSMINRKNKTGGLIIFLVGSYFWLDDYLNIDLHWAQTFWPVFIILIGIYILIKHSGKSTWKVSQKKMIEGGNGIDYIDEVAIFGGGDRNVNSISFKGGKLTCIFGGTDINFANAQLVNEETAVLEVLCIFGGFSLKVPKDWTVHSEVTPILGGFGDDRGVSELHPDPRKVLVIKGLVIFGGGDVKNI